MGSSRLLMGLLGLALLAVLLWSTVGRSAADGTASPDTSTEAAQPDPTQAETLDPQDPVLSTGEPEDREAPAAARSAEQPEDPRPTRSFTATGRLDTGDPAYPLASKARISAFADEASQRARLGEVEVAEDGTWLLSDRAIHEPAPILFRLDAQGLVQQEQQFDPPVDGA